MKKLISFAVFITIIIFTMQIVPTSADGNKPGAGDIWWANVNEINESYYNVSNN